MLCHQREASPPLPSDWGGGGGGVWWAVAETQMDGTTQKKTGGAASAIKASDFEMKQSWRCQHSIRSPDLLSLPIPPSLHSSVPPSSHPPSPLPHPSMTQSLLPHPFLISLQSSVRSAVSSAESPTESRALMRPGKLNQRKRSVLSAGTSTVSLLHLFFPPFFP